MNMDAHVIVIGGGLAGLTAAIHIAKQHIPVILIEKETYPKHKVCGEYISNEVLPYFEFLQLNIAKLNPVPISKFKISTQQGTLISSTLPLGGFGVSRYALDHYLWQQAQDAGVQLLCDEVRNIQFRDDCFSVETLTSRKLTSKHVIGAYGKRSGLDRSLERSFSTKKSPWLAVKAHYRADFDTDTVFLHNFKGGYCGISKVEKDRVNVCYLVNYKSFKSYKNIDAFQDKVMCQNPYLETFFKDAIPLFEKPITISQINFSRKESVSNHLFMTGDAAGLIHPLCGNGMAMAIRSAQIISVLLGDQYHTSTSMSRAALEKKYQQLWKQEFASRLQAGRALQHILLHKTSQEIAGYMAKMAPIIVPSIIRQTHGKPMICS